MIDALRLAVGTLTILPTGRVDVTPRVAGGAMVLAPVAVLPLAVIMAAVAGVGTATGAPPLLVAVVATSVSALGTRAIHLDGLADTVDGLGAGGDRDRALAIMRHGDVGPMGVVALVLVLVAQVAAAASVLDRPYGWLLLGLAVCVSRGTLCLTCARPVRRARPDGLGAAVIGWVPVAASVVTWVLAVLVLSVVGSGTGLPLWQGAVSTVAALAVVLLLVVWTTRRLGGLTGDVLGAGVELGLAVLLAGLAW